MRHLNPIGEQPQHGLDDIDTINQLISNYINNNPPSGFAHLTEDAGTLRADAELVLTNSTSAEIDIFPDGSLELYRQSSFANSNAIGVFDYDSGNPVFGIYGNGQLHWYSPGDDAVLAVDVINNGFAFLGGYDVFLGDPNGNFAVALHNGGQSKFKHGISSDSSITLSDGGLLTATMTIDSSGVILIQELGGGIKLTSPDGGTTKQIQLSNAGTLVLV